MKKLILIFFTIFLSSCITNRSIVSEAKISQIKKGISIEETKKILGNPTSIGQTEEGSMLTYSFVRIEESLLSVTRKSAILIVNYNKKGKAEQIEYIISDGLRELIKGEMQSN
jgi:hypothetical protein